MVEDGEFVSIIENGDVGLVSFVVGEFLVVIVGLDFVWGRSRSVRWFIWYVSGWWWVFVGVNGNGRG